MPEDAAADFVAELKREGYGAAAIIGSVVAAGRFPSNDDPTCVRIV